MVAFEILFACFLALLGLAGSVLTTVYAEWVHQHPWTAYFGWVCLMGSVGFLIAAVVQWRRVHVKLVIHWAKWYGDNENIAVEKTGDVKGWIRPDHSIFHRVHQDELGPNPIGETKRLRVMYSLGRIKHKTVTIVNGENLIIPEV